MGKIWLYLYLRTTKLNVLKKNLNECVHFLNSEASEGENNPPKKVRMMSER